jgi:hypothetical protein
MVLSTGVKAAKTQIRPGSGLTCLKDLPMRRP